MTPHEFTAWKEETRRSTHSWCHDPIRRANGEGLLLYKGGENGHYVLIEKDGQASIGTYNDAFPHIGEALFHTAHSRKFDDFDTAFATVLPKLGLSALLATLR